MWLSLVERCLREAEVAGSTPVTPISGIIYLGGKPVYLTPEHPHVYFDEKSNPSSGGNGFGTKALKPVVVLYSDLFSYLIKPFTFIKRCKQLIKYRLHLEEDVNASRRSNQDRIFC